MTKLQLIFAVNGWLVRCRVVDRNFQLARLQGGLQPSQLIDPRFGRPTRRFAQERGRAVGTRQIVFAGVVRLGRKVGARPNGIALVAQHDDLATATTFAQAQRAGATDAASSHSMHLMFVGH